MNSTAPSRDSRTIVDASLTEMVSSHLGKEHGIKFWTRRRSAYSSSCDITNLRVELDNGESHLFVLKSLHPASWLPTAQQVRPEFLYDSEREIQMYRDVLSKLELGTPEYVGSKVDSENCHYWLLTERVHGPLLWQLGREKHWQESARWLAKFHRATPDVVRLRGTTSINLMDYNEDHFCCWAKRTEEFISVQPAISDKNSMRRFRRILDRYDRVVRFLARLPVTLIHGEFYPSNVMMRRTGHGHSVSPIDWELAGWGPGVLDLAALSFGGWSNEKKRRIIRAYHETALSLGSPPMRFTELLEAVDYCHMHLCLRQLGWAPEWQTPPQHSRNWLKDALGIADKLGLLN